MYVYICIYIYINISCLLFFYHCMPIIPWNHHIFVDHIQYPLANIQKTMENHHLQRENQLFLWTIFNSYHKSAINPMKCPFSYGFPMIFLWFLLSCQRVHPMFAASPVFPVPPVVPVAWSAAVWRAKSAPPDPRRVAWPLRCHWGRRICPPELWSRCRFLGWRWPGLVNVNKDGKS